MKKITLLSLTALLAAGALAAAKLLGQPDTAPDTLPPQEGASGAPVEGGETVAFPLKNKFVDYSRGPDNPVYLFELDTPSGTKEIAVTWAHYETYYIGDEVICRQTGRGLEAV